MDSSGPSTGSRRYDRHGHRIIYWGAMLARAQNAKRPVVILTRMYRTCGHVKYHPLPSSAGKTRKEGRLQPRRENVALFRLFCCCPKEH
jgi:hypothetical protein